MHGPWPNEPGWAAGNDQVQDLPAMAEFCLRGRVIGGLWSSSRPPRKRPKRGSCRARLPDLPRCELGGDITTQEADGQLTWVVSWTAPLAESEVRRFSMRTLGRFGWQVGQASSAHELRLRREDLQLRGYLRFGQPEFGEAGGRGAARHPDPPPAQQRRPEAHPPLASLPRADGRRGE